MKELLFVSIFVLMMGDIAVCAINENIKVDMAGYLPGDAKYAVITQQAKNFTVKNLGTGKDVFLES